MNMTGSISIVDGKWFIDAYPIHPSQSILLSHDLSYKKISLPQILDRKFQYSLEWNPGRGAWVYALVEGIKSQRDYDYSW